MGILSFIYSVLGYNLCATLFIAYLLFDYVLGALATFGARYVMIDNASVEKWYDIEPTADKPLKEGEKSAQIKLSIELHGVKAIED